MDEGAFSRAICGERKFLIALVRKKFRLSTVDAEDFVQTTLLRAWEHRGTYDDQLKMRAWLVVILVNFVLSSKRRAWREQLTDDMGLYEQGAPGNQEDTVFLQQVLSKMLELPIDQLDSVMLLARGYQYAQAGEMLGVACGTIKSRVARGRRALRDMVE